MQDEERPVVAHFLAGKDIGFRAPCVEDAASANLWMIEAARPWAMGYGFPVSRATAEKRLREEETIPWGNNDRVRLVAVDLASGEIVGGALVLREHGRTAWIRSQVAHWLEREEADRLEAEMASVLIGWARTELDLMVIEYVVAGDRPSLIAHIAAHGFTEGTRLREALAGPSGRIDLVWMEAVNERWGSRLVRSEVEHDGA